MNAIPACWTKAYPEALSMELMKRLGLFHASRGGSHGNEIAELIKKDEFLALVKYPIHEYIKEEGWDLLQLIHCRQALGLYQKNSGLNIPGVNPEDAALKTWLDAEERCKQTNEFFLSLSGKCQFVDDRQYNDYLNGRTAQINRVTPTPHFVKLLTGVRALVKSVLGKAPRVCDLKMHFGPGATRTIKRTTATAQNKLAELPTCSYNLYASGLLPQIFEAMPHWTNEHVTDSTVTISLVNTDEGEVYEIEDCSSVDVRLINGRIQFVLKNALTHRAMESQPTIDSAYQLGLGDEMTRRLRRAGIDITNQEINRSWARVGSLTDEVVTIDLTSASDLNAYQLIKAIMPDDWFTLLNAGRTSSTDVKIGGKRQTIALQKFSAMGNGFTFPLETLVFWAVCMYSSQCSDKGRFVSVFGDDIIVHRDVAALACQNLEMLGFLVNNKKSYFSGPFRESCGRDWYRGTSIRPYYQKRLITAMELFQLHNFYVRNNELGEPDGTLSGLVMEYIHPALRRFGPDGYGDGHLLSTSWEARRCRRLRRDGYGGSFFKTFKIAANRVISIYPGDYVTPLYMIYMAESESPNQPQKGIIEELMSMKWEIKADRCPTTEYRSETEFTVSKNGCARPVWDAPGESDPIDSPYEEVEVYTFCRPSA